MKQYFTLFILIMLSTLSGFSQSTTISGRLVETDSGEPLPGVSVLIKGTSIGTVTDLDGNYSISVSEGQVLIFAFVGMTTQEVLVTREMIRQMGNGTPTQQNSKEPDVWDKALEKELSPAYYQDSVLAQTPKKGVAYLSESTPSFRSYQTVFNPKEIKAIKRTPNGYIIKKITEKPEILFKTTFGTESFTKLPEFQKTFSQGRPSGGNFEWFGPDQGEIFSWGPELRNLEYDGSSYPFDVNGKLVPKGSGNSNAANYYNPATFFRPSFISQNFMSVHIKGTRYSNLIVGGSHSIKTGIVPTANVTNANVSVVLNDYEWLDGLRMTPSLRFSHSKGNLMNRGGNYSHIMGSIYRTPTTFDNSNNLSAKAATTNPSSSYLLPDFTQRSHAPGLADNPYGLIHAMPDNESYNRLIGTLNLKYQGDFSIEFNGTADQQWTEIIYGMAPGYSSLPSGRITNKSLSSTFLNGKLHGNYSYWNYDIGSFDLEASWNSGYHLLLLDRFDGTGYTYNDFINQENASKVLLNTGNFQRVTHVPELSLEYEYKNLVNSKINVSSYFSNTLKNQQEFLFPSINISFDPARKWSLYPIDKLKAYINMGTSLNEAPLIYTDWSYLSTVIPLDQYDQFYESSELYWHTGLLPERSKNLETGVNSELFDIIYLNYSFFNNITDDFIAPGNPFFGFFRLQNVAKIRNRGHTVQVTINPYHGFLEASYGLNFTKSRTYVLDTYGATSTIPLTGFSTIQTVLTPGKTFGAIYGTSYWKNANGENIIGNDGFPIEDNNLSVIGDPNPDWIASATASIGHGNWDLNLVFEHQQGGDVWNGTRAILDYLGRSIETGELRNTSNFIFEGVDFGGNQNLTPVSFLDPNLPVDQNRWTRYGWDGIGEAYIEDGSWSRLSELTLSYTFQNFFDSRVRSLKLSATSHNLIIFSPYRGVIPLSGLNGYGYGQGLDLFNSPATRRFSFTATLKL